MAGLHSRRFLLEFKFRVRPSVFRFCSPDAPKKEPNCGFISTNTLIVPSLARRANKRRPRLCPASSTIAPLAFADVFRAGFTRWHRKVSFPPPPVPRRIAPARCCAGRSPGCAPRQRNSNSPVRSLTRTFCPRRAIRKSPAYPESTGSISKPSGPSISASGFAASSPRCRSPSSSSAR